MEAEYFMPVGMIQTKSCGGPAKLLQINRIFNAPNSQFQTDD